MSAQPIQTSVVHLRDAWFIACASHELAAKPVPFTLQGQALVLFRDGAGKPSALTDRCPHRNVPLSLGTVQGGALQCGYHGWCFDSAGTCVAVPGLTGGEVSLRSRAVDAWPCLEQDGYVWVYATPGPMPPSRPFRFPHLDTKGFTSVRRSFTVESTLHAALENTLDVPHTAFLHGGLFRTAKKTNTVTVKVRRLGAVAEAEFVGEPAPKGLIGRILAPGGGVVTHVDRFLMPSIAQVDYALGTSRLISTSVMTPLADFKTRIHAVVTFKLPVPGFVVRPFVAPIVLRILKQDAALLKRQTQTIQAFGGERYTSTPLDVLGPQIWRLLSQAAAGEAAGAADGVQHEHTVTMLT
jgi:phenylpropionate dioxygenase-like ring-hydroxylating dioxygenase large terminal subunit